MNTFILRRFIIDTFYTISLNIENSYKYLDAEKMVKEKRTFKYYMYYLNVTVFKHLLINLFEIEIIHYKNHF